MAPPPPLAAMGRGEDWEAAVQDGGACPWRPRGARVHVVTGLPTAAAMSGAIDQSRHPGGRGSVRRELRAAGLRPASAGGLSRTAGGLTPPPVASRLRWPPSPAVDTHLRPRERQSGASSRAGGVDLRGVVPVAAPYRPPLPRQASVVSARGSGRRGLLAAGVRAAGFRPQIASAPSFPHAYVASPPPLPIPGRLTVALLHADVLFPAVPPPTQAKDALKFLNKRLGNKNSKVQILTLYANISRLLVYCDSVSSFSGARNSEQKFKEKDLNAREKILSLIDTWQVSFGGPSGRYPQYYAAYQELRNAGVDFPSREENTVPLFTPIQTQPLRHPQLYPLPGDMSHIERDCQNRPKNPRRGRSYSRSLTPHRGRSHGRSYNRSHSMSHRIHFPHFQMNKHLSVSRGSLGFLLIQSTHQYHLPQLLPDVVALMDEFARRVYQELNYVQEGQNARRFKKLYVDKQDVLVPDIFWDYTSSKVLTMEWIEGTTLNHQAAIEKQGLKVLDLVNIGIQCSLRQLLEYGYFHADPHPCNILATPEGKLAFLDFGMMSETP
ncbi:hypothetical protein GUJ93_ZPchr0015g6707 [Zizania palustris]|uniref:VHS domain-containing protein n=1 Tax=Zizania palustris TaxID=103762 RepID=A0A8J5W657_ZIZPA|nr:hypothetical protein GUJ93_ZPchr0015g6707 [Zizania palustris]